MSVSLLCVAFLLLGVVIGRAVQRYKLRREDDAIWRGAVEKFEKSKDKEAP